VKGISVIGPAGGYLGRRAETRSTRASTAGGNQIEHIRWAKTDPIRVRRRALLGACAQRPAAGAPPTARQLGSTANRQPPRFAKRADEKTPEKWKSEQDGCRGFGNRNACGSFSHDGAVALSRRQQRLKPGIAGGEPGPAPPTVKRVGTTASRARATRNQGHDSDGRAGVQPNRGKLTARAGGRDSTRRHRVHVFLEAGRAGCVSQGGSSHEQEGRGGEGTIAGPAAT